MLNTIVILLKFVIRRGIFSKITPINGIIKVAVILIGFPFFVNAIIFVIRFLRKLC